MTTATMEPQAIDVSKLSDDQIKSLFATVSRVQKQRKNVASVKYQSANGTIIAPENAELFVKVSGKYILLEGGEPIATRAKNRSTIVSINLEALAEASNGSEPDDDEDYESDDEEDDDDEE